MHPYLFAAVFLALNGFSESFLVSEIFSSRALGKSWIELSVLGEPIFIGRLKVTIYRGKTSEPELILKKDLSNKILFKDKLLLAEGKKLGFAQCLNSKVPSIEIAPLKLKSGQWQKICVELDEQRTCVILGKSHKFSDGLSFYRNLTDLDLEPLWLKEPCYLGDKIFASPGTNARFCADSSVNIFEECPPKNGELKTFKNHASSQPKIIDTQREKSEVVLRMSQNGSDDLWRLNFCVSKKAQSKLCHELEGPKSLLPFKEHRMGLPTWPKAMGTYLALNIRNLSGQNDSVLIHEPQH